MISIFCLSIRDILVDSGGGLALGDALGALLLKLDEFGLSRALLRREIPGAIEVRVDVARRAEHGEHEEHREQEQCDRRDEVGALPVNVTTGERARLPREQRQRAPDLAFEVKHAMGKIVEEGAERSVHMRVLTAGGQKAPVSSEPQFRQLASCVCPSPRFASARLDRASRRRRPSTRRRLPQHRSSIPPSRGTLGGAGPAC